jgi:nitrite reductase/ring-hydroxylating ferredoxin subunit
MSWHHHSKAPQAGHTLCKIESLENNDLQEFIFGEDKNEFRMVVYRRDETVRAYVNNCPHFHITLNKADGDFMLYDNNIWCGHHSAVFRLEDGICIDGPCKSGRLENIPVNVCERNVVIGEIPSNEIQVNEIP